MAKLSPVFNDAQFDDNGNLLVGGLIYTYAANSSSPLATYTDSSGATPQANPIVLDARGEVTSPIWLTEGNTYKLRLFDSLGNFIREFDNVAGVGDSSITLDQWVASGVTPTYVSSTQFTLPGDQTSAFQVGRRVKLTVTAGTVYGIITASAYASLTTITLKMDGASVLDSGLSIVFLGLLTPNNNSIPTLNLTGAINEAKTTVASAATPDIWTGTGNLIDYTGTTTATGFAAAPQAGASRTLVAAAASSFTASANMLIDGWPTGTYKVAANDRIIVTALTTTMFLLQILRADGGTVAQVGEGFDWMVDSTPPYALLCDGSAISRTTYSNLFARIGTLWGAGDGSTTFNLPNIPANYTSVQASGNEGTNTVGALIAHTHRNGTVNGTGVAANTSSVSGGSGSIIGFAIGGNAIFDTGSTGGSSNLAAGVRVRKCIRF